MFGRGVSPKPTMYDVVSYINSVKDAFHDEPAKYDEFLKLFIDVRVLRVLDIASAIGRVDELLQDHQDLLLRLNDFLSAEAQRILHLKIEKGAASDDNKRKRVASFLGKLKARFQGDDRHVYESFLEILNMYQEENKSIVKMYQEVGFLIVSLVQDHEDLFMEFPDILS
ncbi:PREDICTED: paired amphipathic helix protein Sin3-like 3 [Camelina sativa]|uniref:Paired amphipathic helix protein Sin3-like 3 n=1 Tax=Camelina sativa TaxID=90675 RepID=A0ABM0VY34_CAMSA|nr:PREDICTED: paired amphipathic helix protein Sin3-like 3 [Camelina sativa]